MRHPMNPWSQAQLRLTHVTVGPVARAATAAPGGQLEVEPGPHVGCGYQVVLPGERVVHEGGLTLHGPAAQERQLPDELAAAVQALWEHAQQQIADHEGLPPA
jgi:hypothetical protein